jgi:cytochrome b561
MKTVSFAIALARATRNARPIAAARFPSRSIVSLARHQVQRQRVATSRRAMSSGATEEAIAQSLEEKYAAPLRYLHWIMAAGIGGCILTVKMAQDAKGDRKGELMGIHKSFGLLMAAAIVPRVLIRLTSTIPKAVPGPTLEVLAGKAAHYALYAMMLFMPASGIAMGYYGGKGLPFFGWHIPGAETPDGSIAKPAYQWHKQVGQVLEVVIPLHIAAAGYHVLFKGHNILRRVSL